MENNGFFEHEISRTVETFGSISQVFSTYESRRRADDEKPFARGINSIQLSERRNAVVGRDRLLAGRAAEQSGFAAWLHLRTQKVRAEVQGAMPIL